MSTLIEQSARTTIGKGERASAKKCPLLRNGVFANREHCATIGFNFQRNTQNCCVFKCVCEWRICIKCATMVPTPSSAYATVANKETGLCDLHEAEQNEKGGNGKGETLKPLRPVVSEATMNPALIILPPKAKEKPVPSVLDQVPCEPAAQAEPEPEEEDDPRMTEIRRIIEKYRSTPPVEFPVEQVEPDPDQPRTYFNPESMESLTASIRATGQTDPGIVVKVDDKKYRIVDGERRFRAVTTLGIPTYLAWECDQSEAALLYAISVMKNFNREGHTPLETARMLRRMQDDFGYNLTTVAKVTGMKYHMVVFYMKLNDLHPDVARMLDGDMPEAERLTSTAANRIAKLPPDLQVAAAKELQEQGVKAAQADRFVRDFARRHEVELRTRRMDPSDKWKVVRGRFERMGADIRAYEEAHPDEFRNVIRSRTEGQQEEFIILLNKIIDGVTALRDAVRK